MYRRPVKIYIFFYILFLQNVPLIKYFAAEDRIIKIYKPEIKEDWSEIVWPGGSRQMPKDHPPCGWKNELCKRNPLVPTVTSISTFILLLFGFICLAFYVRRKR